MEENEEEGDPPTVGQLGGANNDPTGGFDMDVDIDGDVVVGGG